MLIALSDRRELAFFQVPLDLKPFRSRGPTALADRRSVRCTQRQTLDPKQLQQAVELWQQRLHLRHIARLLKVHFSTVVRALIQLGLGACCT
jgi:ribosomal protein S10